MLFIRSLAVFLFCLSQLFAPLVHAHVGADFSPAALHLPGLEAACVQHDLAFPAAMEQENGLVVQAAKGVRQFRALLPPMPALATVFAGMPQPLATEFVPIFSPFSTAAHCHHLPSTRAPPL